jgi:hypothetical protein
MRVGKKGDCGYNRKYRAAGPSHYETVFLCQELGSYINSIAVLAAPIVFNTSSVPDAPNTFYTQSLMTPRVGCDNGVRQVHGKRGLHIGRGERSFAVFHVDFLINGKQKKTGSSRLNYTGAPIPLPTQSHLILKRSRSEFCFYLFLFTPAPASRFRG